MSEYRKLKSLKFLYEINEKGELRNVKSKKVVKGYVEKNGYRRVRIENKCLGGVVRTTIHRLVAEAFIPNPDNLPQVNHIDCDKLNNCASNLEWVSGSENMKHAYAHGINRRPLRQHSEETRKEVSNGEQTFESISAAGRWLFEQGLTKSWRSGISGISQVIRRKKDTCGGYHWVVV